ncbi:tRNA (uracil-5-)-methyltransferase homolog A-like [Chelonus insularis]|uniref:tRNA (uracil-5-)-methyltransferase homolog A-like n=1 Tax=Chelonus insularis TaxID=460826 RepID=UPI00158DA7A7|nr:tRNA (uracil-5-)-methyltransferase homolog A-like [Chelonus insularis]
MAESTVASNNIEDNKHQNNPYAYLSRDDFTSEKFKIEVSGLPKYYGIKEFKKLLNDKLHLNTCKVKPLKKKSHWMFVAFRNEDDRERAISIIDGYMWKNCKLMAKKAKAAPDPLIKRRIEADADTCNKKIKFDENGEEIPTSELVKSSTIPLWDVPYSEQLSFKQKEMKSIITQLGENISRENRSLGSWVKKQQEKNDGLICELKPILSTNVTEGYRNKCEFTIGKSRDGDEIIIGFRLASYAAGSTAVGPIDDLCHISSRMKTAVKIFQNFVKESKLDVYDPVCHTGFWSQVVARTSRLDHLMLIIAVHPQDMTEDQLTELKSKIRNFFEEGEGKEANVTSLYFKIMKKKNSEDEDDSKNYEHLSGCLYIEELLFDLKLRISPRAFFQINTHGAEVLYKAAIELAECNSENTSFLDICCGTGTIGLCFAKYCGEVLGLEMIKEAITDAKENAKRNNITNCDFFVGKAEDLLKAVIQRTTKSEIIAVVDPPRAGLHHHALLSLRKAKKLTKLLYISCDPKAAIKNLIDFARPVSKTLSGEPLVPVKAIPVDMFPHTNHCELVILLERIGNLQNTDNTT